jgi:hypothetical protein
LEVNMKLVKSLLLGSAAGLCAVAGAQAADLPVRKAAPAVEYVRVCSAYGAGFFFIPGTETCLRIAGRVRAEVRVDETFAREQATTGFRLRTQTQFDARTQTAFGPLRTFVRLRHEVNSGPYSSAATFSSYANTAEINQGFVQFGGFTAGRIESFFSFYADTLNWVGATGSDTFGNNPVVFAYSATFGAGFSATISVEDRTARTTVGTFGTTGAFPGTPAGVQTIAYAGQRLPDIVGVLRVDQAWGSAQLAGAIHEVRALNRVPVGVAGAGTFVDTEYGFAVMGGAKINLPMLAPGDQLWLEATYSQGATSYNGFGTSTASTGRIGLPVADAFRDPFGNLKMTEMFTATAAFLHYWTPQIRQAVFASYTKADVPASVTALVDPATGARAVNAINDFDYLLLGTNIVYSPVAGLDLGVEVAYIKADPRGRVASGFASTLPTAAPRTSPAARSAPRTCSRAASACSATSKLPSGGLRAGPGGNAGACRVSACRSRGASPNFRGRSGPNPRPPRSGAPRPRVSSASAQPHVGEARRGVARRPVQVGEAVRRLDRTLGVGDEVRVGQARELQAVAPPADRLARGPVLQHHREGRVGRAPVGVDPVRLGVVVERHVADAPLLRLHEPARLGDVVVEEGERVGEVHAVERGVDQSRVL